MHVLPGDSLVETFEATELGGEVAICRECLVDGKISAETLEEFWSVRASFLDDQSNEPSKLYEHYAKPEFEKILSANTSTTVNLWFEYELFCQVNMWFCLFLLRNSNAEIFRVEPIVRTSEDVWKGFGRLNAVELKRCFAERKKLSNVDVELGSNLWKAFQTSDFAKLIELSKSKSQCFPYLEEVCKAATELETRPKFALQKIIEGGENDFGKVFRKFNETEGIYGFGDLQVRRIFDEIQTEREL